MALSDTEKIETLIDLMYHDLMKEGKRFKIMELLRALEFKRKIAPPDDREGAFWNMIDEIRASELKQPKELARDIAELPAPPRNTPSIRKTSSAPNGRKRKKP